MIPIRLELHNFLPYRNPDPIFFEGIHLACLTGNNGAGKSSILDAITWVLWGRSRGKTEGELIHLGQNDMYVKLDIEHDGQVYSVLRQRSAGKNGKGALDFFIKKSDGQLQSLKEPNMRDTQRKITQLLKLDYDTFITSAFLQQGKADAFTTKTASERKQVLSDILGIDRWSAYEENAKAKLKIINETLQRINGSLQEIEEDIRKEPQYQRELADAQIAHENAQTALTLAQQALKEVESAPNDLRHVIEQLHQETRRLKELQSDVEKARAQAQKHREKIAEYLAILQDEETILQGYETLRTARDQDSTLGQQLRLVRELETRKADLEKQIQKERNDIQQLRSGILSTIQELTRTVEHDPTEQLAQIQIQVDVLKQQDGEREAFIQANATLKEERGQLTARMKQMELDGKELNDRIEKLEKAEGASCPLCGQPLTETHRTEMLGQLNEQRVAMRQVWKTDKERNGEIEQFIGANEKQIDSIGTTLARLPRLQAELGKLQKQQADVHQARTRLISAEAELNSYSTTLDTDSFAFDVRSELEMVLADLQHIQYDDTQHASVQQTLRQFSSYESEKMRLEVAKSNLPTEESGLHNAEQFIERYEKSIAEVHANIEALGKQQDALTVLAQEYERRNAEVKHQHTLFSQSASRLGAAEQQLTSIESQKKRRERFYQERDNQLVQQSLYDELKIAFGKNGVPAMIIESAIPELELLANELLTRMTDGRMHLRLTTQQEKLDGGLRETLDIEIADDLGTRAYEMYSGGEAFRINFALRIALSKMLARRAGAQLQTLFIDEGFGTQDEDGRVKLVEAINAIQDDFRLILVITHIDELRDSFPVHIVVEKTNAGSMVSVR